MTGFFFFNEILIILACSIPVIYIFNKIKFPSIIGFLITGIIIGPYGLKLIHDISDIQLMAEIGVAFLLFTIGIEISFKRFLQHLSEITLTGGLQVLITLAAGTAVGLFMQLSWNQSVFVGFLLAHSSSALILKILSDRSDEESPQGRISIGIVLFQDIIVVPMMLFIPLLAGSDGAGFDVIVWNLLRSLLIIASILIAARYIVPLILEKLVEMRMRDVFIIASVVITLGIAWLTHSLGLSLAIGAFLAGLAISDTDFTHQIISDINPFRDIFLSVFFVSFGMMLDLHFFGQHPLYIIAITLLIILIKSLIVFSMVRILNYPFRTALLSGVLLSQIGEFSFVLASQGMQQKLISDFIYQGFIGASVLTFVITPVLISVAYKLLAREKNESGCTENNAGKRIPVENHVIICGMGLNGRNLVRVLKDTAINYVIIDTNFKNIKKAKVKGDKNLIWGDAASPEILKHASIETARVLVIAISDRFLTKRCLHIAKTLKPNLHVIVRTKYVADIDELVQLGADDIIPEEFETSIQILSRVLKMFHVPNSIILAQGNIIRNKSYGIFREIRFTEEAFDQIQQVLSQGTIETYFVATGNINTGHSIRDINLKAKSGATIINIIRNNQTITNPPSEFVLQTGDQLVIFGSHSAIDLALKVLDGKQGE
ncbi:MAG TPA: cation:proton antiporter [Smithellaceae bacterium]|nr:cation:proton antiporter [Smithellaceae bacterium]